MSYRLVRTLPDGTERDHTDLKSMRQAATAMAYCLTDNLGLRRRDVEPLAFQLENSPVGTKVAAYGYTFRVEQS